jgi:4-hydroxy-tetrahydrodipicolinate reductase
MKIALIGYGKMGKTIEALALADGLEIALTIDADSTTLLTSGALTHCDVAIEFSRPDTAVENILHCFRAGIPVVVGTTGWLDKLTEVNSACKKHNGALFYASNFSIGVNLFFEINKRLAALMNQHPEYTSVFVHETHHVHKLDAPSGTAISIANQLVHGMERFNKWESHPFNDKQESTESLPVYYTREDEVPGTHTVHYSSPVDEIEITHKAYSRDGFARGALTAARWIIGRKGVFTMEDLLSLNG